MHCLNSLMQHVVDMTDAACGHHYCDRFLLLCRTYAMWPIAPDVCLGVCMRVCVGHTGMFCKHG